MEKSVQITLIIVSAVIVLALIGILAYTQFSTGNTISSSGSSQISVMPDKVGVYFNIETKGETSKEAKDKNAEISDNLITALIKQGFDRDEIQTQNYNIYPEYEWRESQELIGYKSVHSIKLEFSTQDSDKIGEVIDAGVDAGASISYINFELSLEKQNEYKAQALEQATQDARTKAEAIASGLGKSLGRIVSVSDSSFDYYPWRMYDMVGSSNAAEAKQAVTSIQPGNQEINAQVSVVYKIGF